MKRIFLLTFLLLALPMAAQVTTASIGGRVVNENGPLEGVTVVAIYQPTNAQYYATTDRHGWYQLLDVQPGGPYTVRIFYIDNKPLTVRNLYTYSGQNTLIDADLDAGTTQVRVDEAATSLRLGRDLGGGTAPVSPLGFDLVSQRIYSPVVFDVRQEAPLAGAAQQWTVPTGANTFHGSAYGFYGMGIMPDVYSSYAPPEGLPETIRQLGLGGLTLALPLGSEDYQLFGGLEYGTGGLSAAGRFDGRINSENRLEISGGRLAGGLGAAAGGAGAAGLEAWAAAAFTSLLGERSSNRAQAGWYGSPMARQLRLADDYTLAAGPQRLLAGFQLAHQNFLAVDSAATRFDFYLQDVVRLGRRMTILGGVRFSFPFAFSPRLSLNYDLLGNGILVMRAGTAVYGRHGEGTIWKNLAAVDTRLPLDIRLTLEGILGQSWQKAFHISKRNVLDSHYALTARLERPFSDNFWALASYTHSDGMPFNYLSDNAMQATALLQGDRPVRDRLMAGFSYKVAYLSRLATTLAVFYDGCSLTDNLSPASFSWQNNYEARLSQDIIFSAAGRDHTLQLTGYVRRGPSVVPTVSTGITAPTTTFLVGLRYFL